MSRRMKTKIAHIQGALGGWLEHEGVQGWMVVPSAITFPWSRTSGWENGSRCQWWSSLFWIRRVTPEELHSLSKTTKLLLLDSLLQEVCIESGSDGSLALSSLGLSVCLVSHNLLYSGLKKAHLKMRTKSRIKNMLCLDSLRWNFVDDQKHLESNKLGSRGFCWPPSNPFGRLTIRAGVNFLMYSTYLSQSLSSCCCYFPVNICFRRSLQKLAQTRVFHPVRPGYWV